MGIFGKLFGNKNNKSESNTNKEIFYAQQNEKMKDAYVKAQQNFKYFWRELYWEYRRIIYAHSFAMVKIPFEQTVPGQTEPLIEHMWINNINFDGEIITGELVNDPNQLTNVTKGDLVSKPISEIDDWMISIQGKVYGGFTIQVMRSGMSEKERKSHDTAWGLDFGDYNEILLVYKQKENPENLLEHPMSKNMAENMREYLIENPNELTVEDENGLTLLHREAIAGNKINVEILLELGADKTKKSKANKTALEYVELMNWENVAELLN